MSSTGVPSMRSTPEMYTVRFFMSTLSIFANVMPIGFGRCGDRVLKIPTLSLRSGGEIFAYKYIVVADD